MKKIKSLTIASTTVKITYRQISEASGETQLHPAPAIIIHEDLKGLELAKTIYHEAMHVLLYLTGGDDMEWKEERLVRWIETHTTALLRDNPDLAKGLLK